MLLLKAAINLNCIKTNKDFDNRRERDVVFASVLSYLKSKLKRFVAKNFRSGTKL